MKRKSVLIIAGLLLAVVAYLAYTFGFASAGDRPTLMYFRADL